MLERPTVSIVVPSYCHEAFIAECLESIHDQTYGPIELVVVDDRSTDSTFERAEKALSGALGRRFEKVTLVKNEINLGAHDTINRGIRETSGHYVAIINSDDLYQPTRIAMMLEAMQEQKSELAFSLVEVFATDFSGAFPHDFLAFSLRQKLNILREPTVGFSLLRQNVGVSTGNFLFTRSLYDRVGPFLPLKYCHDWDFAMQALCFTEPVAVMESLYRYRLHGQNSFSSLAHMASVESEVVFRRFFRRCLMGQTLNPLCPTERNWPGFFERFIALIDKTRFLERESGAGLKSWRIYEK